MESRLFVVAVALSGGADWLAPTIRLFSDSNPLSKLRLMLLALAVDVAPLGSVPVLLTATDEGATARLAASNSPGTSSAFTFSSCADAEPAYAGVEDVDDVPLVLVSVVAAAVPAPAPTSPAIAASSMTTVRSTFVAPRNARLWTVARSCLIPSMTTTSPSPAVTAPM